MSSLMFVSVRCSLESIAFLSYNQNLVMRSTLAFLGDVVDEVVEGAVEGVGDVAGADGS